MKTPDRGLEGECRTAALFGPCLASRASAPSAFALDCESIAGLVGQIPAHARAQNESRVPAPHPLVDPVLRISRSVGFCWRRFNLFAMRFDGGRIAFLGSLNVDASIRSP
jgi:hypothetical protein